MFGKKGAAVDKNALEAAQNELDFNQYKYQLDLDTTKGNIKLDFWPDVAPNHVKNMLGLAKVGFYDGLVFHRVIKGFVIQGGCPEGTGTGGPGYKVKQEFNKMKHEAGVLSMARAADPDSAGSQFFLCLERVPHLDNQYTAFGKTADDESLKVVKAIGDVRTGAGDRPNEEMKINKATVTQLPL